ncbi:MAG: UvrD-helicase domain-containing protein [Aquirufa sp.]
MNSQALKLFSASAGSGKTYRLTLEYIKLALHVYEPKGYFRHILAVTFTIKAAEEMRARIISFLTGIACAPKFENISLAQKNKTLELIAQIKNELEEEHIFLSEDEIINRAKITLQQILQDYGLFSVMTIDAFVQRLSSNFVDELDLPNQFDVIIDTNMLINQLIDRILDKVNETGDNELKKLLLSFAQEEVDEGRNWNNLRKSLQQFFKICFNESFFNVEKDISKFSIKDFLEIERKIQETLILHKNTLLKIAEKFIQTVDLLQISDANFTYGEKGPVGYFRKFIHQPFIESNKFTYLIAACQNNKWNGGKVDAGTKAQIDSIALQLSELGHEFLEYHNEVVRNHQLYQLIKKDIKKMALLNSVQAELKVFQNENSSISISEFSRKIYEIISNDPVPFIYEKLGDRYFHILIDEFQDTSILQWQNFMPMIENAVSIGKKSLLVGDAKQSIYKFRSGEVGLIASLSSKNKDLVANKLSQNELDQQRFEFLLDQTVPHNLKSNYRSAHEIVSFNNQFYQWIVDQDSYKNLSRLLEPVYGKQLAQNAEISADKLTGSVDCLVLEKNTENISNKNLEQDWMFQQVVNLIHLNIRDNNFQYKDIAILTRKNKDSKYLALQLKELNIPVISADSLLIHYSAIVRFIIAWFKLLNKPNSELIFFELLFLFAEIKNVKISLNEVDELKKVINKNYLSQAKNYFEKYDFDLKYIDFETNSIVKLSYGIVHEFDLFQSNETQDYILKFLDIINEFSLNQTDTLSEFLYFFEENKSNLCIASPDDQNAITITSIHKSKGLEYPVVILPFASWTHQAQSEEIWFDFENELNAEELYIENKGYLDKFYFKVKNKILDDSENLSSQKLAELDAIFLDSLNMLYVATTRPKQKLHLLITNVSDEIKSVTKTIFSNSIGKILFDFINEKFIEIELTDDYTTTYQTDTKLFQLQKNKQVLSVSENDQARETKLISLDTQLTSNPLLRISSSKKELFNKAANKRKKGELAHLILSKIDSLDSYQSNYQFDFNEFENSIKLSLSNPAINQFFNQGELLFAEQDILCPNGQIIRPDRVVVIDETTWIVDFKTGNKSDNHKKQIQEYVSVLMQMGYKNVKGVLIYLESQETIYV